MVDIVGLYMSVFKRFFLLNHHLSLRAETVRVDFSSFETNVRTRELVLQDKVLKGAEQTEPWDLSSI